MNATRFTSYTDCVKFLPMPSIYNRFWKKVEKKSKKECWNWTGAKLGGYGRINVNGKNKIASRVVWEFFNKKIPRKDCVLHSCDNRACVNPSHLFIDSRTDNSQDMVRKNRQRGAKGERNGRSKLTYKLAEKIRRDYKTKKFYQYELSKKYGVSQPVISKITRNERWVP
jgi:predicted XRE-type DNA-binding protein